MYESSYTKNKRLKKKKRTRIILIFIVAAVILSISITPRIQGDINGDGEVSLRDLLLLQRYLLRIEDVPYTELRNYDVNGDGVVNEKDLDMLRNILLGIE